MKAAVTAIKLFEKFSSTGFRGKIMEKFFSGLLKIIKPRGKLVLENLARVYPESSDQWRKNIRSQVYENIAWTLTETLALQRDHSQVSEWVKSVKNVEIVNDLMAKNQGALLLTSHFGNWELAGSWAAQNAIKHGHELHVIFQKMHDEDINNYVLETRKRSGMVMIDKNFSVMKVARMLKKGAHIALLNDVAGDGRVKVPFMGIEATNMPGAALMAMLSGCPVIPACLYRNAPFEHELEFFEPLKLPTENEIQDREERLRLIILEMNKAVEIFIRRRPELWFWLHKRWRK